MAVAGRILNQRYRLDHLIGQGGFARVFRATDLLLERVVAVKVLNPELAQAPGILARFTTEARIVATLKHPNIVTIHDIGQPSGTAYLVMEYIDGGSLHDRLAGQAPLSLATIASYLRQVAAALDFAHARGIVHRDIKPGNMLLGAGDQLYLSDFGIAKVLGATDASGHTRPVGTLAYIAPEQFDGRVSPASDVYALGCVLFQLLTGHVPYNGDAKQVVAGHLVKPIPVISASAADLVPSTLQSVFDRALAKQPAERFQSAGELANAFNVSLSTDRGDATNVALDDVSVSVPRAMPLYASATTISADPQLGRTESARILAPSMVTAVRAPRWGARGTRAVGGLAVLALLLSAAFVAGTLATGRLTASAPTYDRQTAIAPAPTVRATVTQLAGLKVATSQPTAIPAPATEPALTPTVTAVRTAIPTVMPPTALPPMAPTSMPVARTPTAPPVAAPSLPERPFATLTGYTDYVVSVAWSPNGKILASASYDHTVRLWSAEGRLVKTLTGHTDAVTSVAWSPDSKTLASGAADNTVRLWSTEGRLLNTFVGHRNSVFSVAWSPDGRVIASGSGKISALDIDLYEIRLWSTDGRSLAILQGHTGSIMGLAWSPDSRILASASADGAIRLWSAAGAPLATLVGHTDRVISVAWSPDGTTLASASGDGTVRLWSAVGRPVATLLGHTGYVTGVAWSPDSTALATSSYDATVRLWSLTGKQLGVLSGHTDKVRSVAWSPDGKTLASGSWDKTIRLWR